MPKMTSEYSEAMRLHHRDSIGFFSSYKKRNWNSLYNEESVAREVLFNSVLSSTTGVRSMIQECAFNHLNNILQIMTAKNYNSNEIQDFKKASNIIFDFFIQASYSIEKPMFEFIKINKLPTKPNFREATSLCNDSLDRADKLFSDVHSKFHIISMLHSELKATHGGLSLITLYIDGIKQFADEIENGHSWKPEPGERRLCARVF